MTWVIDYILRWFTCRKTVTRSAGPDLAGGRPGAEFCLSKIVLLTSVVFMVFVFAQFYIDIVVFVVWKYSDCFNVLY